MRAFGLLVFGLLLLSLGCSSGVPYRAGGGGELAFENVSADVVRTDTVNSTIWPKGAPFLNGWSAVCNTSGAEPGFGSYYDRRPLEGDAAEVSGNSLLCPGAGSVVLRWDHPANTKADIVSVGASDLADGVLHVTVDVQHTLTNRFTPAPGTLIIKTWDLAPDAPREIRVTVNVYKQDCVGDDFTFADRFHAPVVTR